MEEGALGGGSGDTGGVAAEASGQDIIPVNVWFSNNKSIPSIFWGVKHINIMAITVYCCNACNLPLYLQDTLIPLFYICNI